MADALSPDRPQVSWVAVINLEEPGDCVEFHTLGFLSEGAAKERAAALLVDGVRSVQLYSSVTMGTLRRVVECRWGN